MHASYNCPGCGSAFGEMTDHPASEKKCPDCLAGVWAGGEPKYLPGQEAAHAKYFLPFLRDQAAKGVQAAKDLLEKYTAREDAAAAVDPSGEMLPIQHSRQTLSVHEAMAEDDNPAGDVVSPAEITEEAAAAAARVEGK
jgi:hypothetical protein